MKKEQLITPLTMNEYQKLASFTRDKNISYTEALTNGALGLTGEAGEVAEIIKKCVFHGHTMNEDDFINELGDVQWYIADLASTRGITLEEIACRNIDKLRKRYPGGFNKNMSINRVENKNTLK